MSHAAPNPPAYTMPLKMRARLLSYRIRSAPRLLSYRIRSAPRLLSYRIRSAPRRWLGRWVRRLLCPHRWEPVNDWFYGAHSSFDILTKTPRRWKCCDCGKEIVTRHMPVSYVPPNIQG